MEYTRFRRGEQLQRVEGANAAPSGLFIWTLTAGHENCPYACYNKVKCWFIFRRPDRVPRDNVRPPAGAREWRLANQLAMRENCDILWCSWGQVLEEQLRLRIESIWGVFLCYVNIGMFQTGEQLRRASAEILGLPPDMVELGADADEFVLDNRDTLWEQHVTRTTTLWLRRIGIDGM